MPGISSHVWLSFWGQVIYREFLVSVGGGNGGRSGSGQSPRCNSLLIELLTLDSSLSFDKIRLIISERVVT
jgi:hypothetical protein